MLEASSSIFVLSASAVAISSAMLALKSSTCAWPVFISKPKLAALSEHHSAYSSYSFWAASPSAMTLASNPASKSTTLVIGEVSSARAREVAAARTEVAAKLFMATVDDSWWQEATIERERTGK